MRELASSESPVAVVAVRELTALISECYKHFPKQKKANPAKDFPHIIFPGKQRSPIYRSVLYGSGNTH